MLEIIEPLTNYVAVAVRQDLWNTIESTLEADADSSYFDNELREEISRALSGVVYITDEIDALFNVAFDPEKSKDGYGGQVKALYTAIDGAAAYSQDDELTKMTVDDLEKPAIGEGFDPNSIYREGKFPYYSSPLFDVLHKTSLSQVLLLIYHSAAPDIGDYRVWYVDALCQFHNVTEQELEDFAEANMEL